MARAFSLRGTIQNLNDGRVKVIAEGEENDLERFLKAIDIKNTVIHVSSISREYSEATGDFESFYKLVEPGETDSRLDQGVVVLKEILGAIKDMNADIKDMNTNLGGKMDQMLEKQDQTIEEVRGLRQEIQPGVTVQLRHVQEDIRAIKERLGMP